ncbi:response regulator transcription factor [Slackia heliotrinireducens]|uniref:Response regulator with CheY-like receiver domain and winged-helix DNA-binding domain n=1 Tax=Slackia heliotrinireducens (strain ATCC 29202 / DSM 20476 / NCTC 11029 / RHS 1) TaxID=471855 RepID=C7N1W1_SLAHD|nr:response regulator transcription factor [Slackia heliotrinireducens]ACV23402.1 response regulator with CheY-like receiver domain and winged-helix DNA-binding domain [Slackia heliotrinireducens DSM 20476]VEH02694.1 Transcriptional regulatory protein tcrA [Slackia heliotrinireducens]
MSSRVLYAEDTRDLNRAVSAVLKHQGFDVTSCFDGVEASKALASSRYDVVVLDIMMPNRSGLDVLKDMRAEGDVTPVLLLTAKTEVDDRVAGLEAGADDYLSKPFAMKELVARIKSLDRRNTDYGVGNLSFGNVRLNAETFELAACNSVRLSHQEFELMRTLILNTDRDLSADFLLGRVWGAADDADAATVDLYIRYLGSKLQGIQSNVMVKSSEAGYRLVEGDLQ